MKKLALLLALAACNGGDPNSPGPDASSGADGAVVPAMITVAGQAAEVSTTGLSPMAYLEVEAYDRNDEVTPVATTTTDMLGNYSLTIPTAGKPFEGYIKARETGYVDTYLYAPSTLTSSYEGAPLRMAKPDTIGLLNDVCASTQLPSKGTIVAIATDDKRVPVEGVTFSSTPASNKYCYNGDYGFPSSVRLTTRTDGVGYVFNVTGPITVTATKSGATFQPRLVTARADVITMVLLAP